MTTLKIGKLDELKVKINIDLFYLKRYFKFYLSLFTI